MGVLSYLCMKQSTLEPGLLQTFRFYAIVLVFLAPLSLRLFGVSFGIDLAWDRYLLLIMPVPIFLLIYATLPWWQVHLGSAFLPFGLLLLSADALVDKYLTVSWLVSPSMRELTTLLLMLRLWVMFQVVVVFVAWQFNAFWVAVCGITLCLLDVGMSFRYINLEGPLYSLFVAIAILRLLAITTVGLGLAWLMSRQRQQRAALAEANRKLGLYAAATEQLAISQERNRLARELHDTLAHSLSSIKVQLTAADALWQAEPNRAHQMLLNAMDTTLDGLNGARRALTALRASPLEDLGLGLAVRDLAESTAARANLKLDLDVPGHLENISPDVEQCVYRVAQEALTNVARHARASGVWVALAQANGALTLTIADDGRGFNPAMVNGAHYGLRGMRERVELMGGVLSVTSVEKQGATVSLRIANG